MWETMRASDADRQRAADVLKAALAEGRLTMAEHESRLHRALSAKTYGDLQEVVHDLPSGAVPFVGPAAPITTAPPWTPPTPAPHAGPWPPAQVTPRSHPMATASLVLGIFGLVSLGVTSVPAIVLGHVGLSRIGGSGFGGGRGLAVGGLMLGYVGAFLMLVRMLLVGGF